MRRSEKDRAGLHRKAEGHQTRREERVFSSWNFATASLTNRTTSYLIVPIYYSRNRAHVLKPTGDHTNGEHFSSDTRAFAGNPRNDIR
jgi:hypothetical protein